jgi:hypothetical protein
LDAAGRPGGLVAAEQCLDDLLGLAVEDNDARALGRRVLRQSEDLAHRRPAVERNARVLVGC